MKKSLLAAAALAALVAAPATAGTLGTVVTPVVTPPPPPPPPGGLNPWVAIPIGLVLVCAVACSDDTPAPVTPVTGAAAD